MIVDELGVDAVTGTNANRATFAAQQLPRVNARRHVFDYFDTNRVLKLAKFDGLGSRFRSVKFGRSRRDKLHLLPRVKFL